MASTAIETARAAHEDIERALRLCGAALVLAEGGTSNENLQAAARRFESSGISLPRSSREAGHMARSLADLIKERRERLLRLYEPGGAVQQEDKEAMSTEGQDPISEFYFRLRELKEIHHNAKRDEQPEVWSGVLADQAVVNEIPPPPAFSGEEHDGRYLDLHSHFSDFANLMKHSKEDGARKRSRGSRDSTNARAGSLPKAENAKRARLASPNSKRDQSGETTDPDEADSRNRKDGASSRVDRADYLAYLKTAISDVKSVPASTRNSSAYRHYIQGLTDYLVSFAERSYPLAGVPAAVEKEKIRVIDDVVSDLASVCEEHSTPEQALNALGPDGVRDCLLEFGMKGGGRPLDRAKRLFDASKQASSGSVVLTGPSIHRVNAMSKLGMSERVLSERIVEYLLADVLPVERHDTIQNVEKKLSLSWTELEAERVAEEARLESAEAERSRRLPDGRTSDDSEDEQPIYNPKDIPLGWDGKPIPFWLYKLHGLNLEFKCEICGGATYKGPRVFERHFTEAQHIQGLKCLGISYSKQYHMVTGIADATRLKEKLSQEVRQAAFDADHEMEFEDGDGNVFNRKTLVDLEKQGLL